MERSQLQRILEFYRDNIAGEIEIDGALYDLRRHKIEEKYVEDFEEIVDRLEGVDLEEIAQCLFEESKRELEGRSHEKQVLTLIQSRAILKRVGRIPMTKTEVNHISLIRRKYRNAKRIVDFLHFVERF